MTTTPINSSSVKVSWELVLCSARNGEITGYLINYTSTAVNDESDEFMAQPDTSSKIITDLSPCIVYSFRVAAVNINGTGPFSKAVNMSTNTSGIFCYTKILIRNTQYSSVFLCRDDRKTIIIVARSQCI